LEEYSLLYPVKNPEPIRLKLVEIGRLFRDLDKDGGGTIDLSEVCLLFA
jgi:hypothetical protein